MKPSGLSCKTQEKKKIKKMKNSLVIQGDRIKILSILKTWTLTYSPNPKTVFSQEHGLWKWHKLEQIRIFYTVNDKHRELAIQEVTENIKDPKANGIAMNDHC